MESSKVRDAITDMVIGAVPMSLPGGAEVVAPVPW
jgi:hypothetical protein